MKASLVLLTLAVAVVLLMPSPPRTVTFVPEYGAEEYTWKAGESHAVGPAGEIMELSPSTVERLEGSLLKASM